VVITLVFAVYAFALLVTLLVAGSISDHLGRRPVIIGALIVEIIAMALFVLADGAAILIAARIVQGVATGIASASLGAALVDADARRAPFVNATAPLAGMAIGALGTSALVQFSPYPLHSIYVLLLVAFATGLGAMMLLRMPSARRPGALSSLWPRVSIPASARQAFVAVTPINIAQWMLAGFYLSLVPALVAETTGNRSPLVSGLLVAGLMVTGTVAVLFRRSRPALANLRWGVGFVVMGVLTVAAGVNLGSVPILALGTIISGVGFGTSFLGSTGYLMPLAGPEDRAELLSAYYVESYLAFSLPLIAAGYLVREAGYVVTINLFAGALLILAAIGLPFLLRKAG